ncbi:uncharacterized protein TNCV_4463301 [Trichonephila clavipes]|nr:uncharacterized protein TNCV_4463301 [Trichonephila clavipes]
MDAKMDINFRLHDFLVTDHFLLFRDSTFNLIPIFKPQYSDEDISLSDGDCEESEESADEINNNTANPDIYDARDGTEWIPHNNKVPGRFTKQDVLRQISGPSSFAKHNINISFL